VLLAAGIALVGKPAPEARAVLAPPAQPSRPAAQIDVGDEVSRLENALLNEVPDLVMDQPQAAQEWIARASAIVAAAMC
jgi:hypothetical protein